MKREEGIEVERLERFKELAHVGVGKSNTVM